MARAIQNELTVLTACGVFVIASLFPPVGNASLMQPVVVHHARIVLDPAAHTLTVSDTLQVPAGLDTFGLNPALDLEAVQHLTLSSEGVPGASLLVCPALTDVDGTVKTTRYVLSVGAGVDSGAAAARPLRTLVMTYHGTFYQAVDDVSFSRERVGGEIEATISDEGIYLASGATWLPTFGDGVLVTHRLTVQTPAGIEPITQGVRIHHAEESDRLLTVWEASHPSDGLNLVAGRFIITAEEVGDIATYTYLLEDDPRLSALYLERTAVYLEMYEEMIGPYPYGKFATVENWFPTGYGMPSYTLLGGTVLRLPFIPYTSFGHEICHNWWGNSVFVDPAQGNWCEGLTVYCADYHYKDLESPAAAREYRRNLLKDYAAYVKEGKDFPLSTFESRHSGATRAVGYGKSMMVFHMIERRIGRDAFLAALRKVYAEKLFQKASWSDFFSAFSAESGRDLSSWQLQWLTRSGAPELAVDGAHRRGDRIVLELSQDEPAYDLQVPVLVTTAAGSQEHVVSLTGLRGEFELQVAGATSVTVDPDYHLFRRLDPAEIEPTLSQVLGEDDPFFVLPAGDESEVAAAREFAQAFAEDDAPAYCEGGHLLETGEPGKVHSAILLNPGGEMVKRWSPPELTVAGSYAFFAGKRYSLKEYNLVFTAPRPGAAQVTDLLVLCLDPAQLPSLAPRLGHYGKYSWLLFPTGQGPTLKGNWTAPANPLVVTFD